MAPEDHSREGRKPPPHQAATWVVLGLAVVLVGSLFAVRCELGPETARAYPSRSLPAQPEPVLLPPPPMDDEYVPCDDCHDRSMPANREVRELEDEHDEMELAHGDLWCLHCHDSDRDSQLHLADRSLVPFEESWRQCTGCHGTKLADWRAGVHGKRTGHWWGPKEVWNCVACHDAHAPAFKPLEPKPVPQPPAQPRFFTRASPEDPS